MSERISYANVIEHAYQDGYGRTHLNKPYWIVTCGPCGAVLNSGHHYRDVALAHQAADEHDHLVHGQPLDTRQCFWGDDETDACHEPGVISVYFNGQDERVCSRHYPQVQEVIADMLEHIDRRMGC